MQQVKQSKSVWEIGGKKLKSRILIGSALYPSPAIMKEAIVASGAEVVTLSLRRQSAGDDAGERFFEIIASLGVHLLPNTAGCHSAKEAITTAQMAREMFGTNWIKLEVIGDTYTLQPDPFATLEAARELIAQGFEVFPYMSDDLVLASRLVESGVKILMPWGSPIGSGMGLINPYNLKTLRERFRDIALIVDAGLGKPSHAVEAMEMGYDGVLLNSAVALAHDPVKMAQAFSHGVTAGRLGYEAGMMPKRSLASPSTPTIGTPFWHQDQG